MMQSIQTRNQDSSSRTGWAGKAATLALAMLAAFTPAAGIRAADLYVPNGSFESPATTYVLPLISNWEQSPQPAGFDTNVFGAWDELLGVFANVPAGQPGSITNATGSQLAYLFAYPQLAIFQDYTSTDWSSTTPSHAFNAIYEPGRAYHLTFGLTTSSYEPLTTGSTLLVSLYYRDTAGSQVTVGATNITFDPAVFTNLANLNQFELDVPAVNNTDPWAGRNIGIQIMSTVDPTLIGGVWDIDNVSLTSSINVPNFSFELPVTAYAYPLINNWEVTAQPSDFDTNVFGAWDELAGEFANLPAGQPGSVVNANGNQLAYFFAYPQLGIFQDYESVDWTGVASHAFNATYDAGKAYTLTVGLTTSSYEPLTEGSTLSLSLYYRDAGGNQVTIASTTASYDTNLFANPFSLIDFRATIPEVKATDPWAGQYIGIEILSTVNPYLIGGVWDLDNVRLDETVAPALTNPQSANGQFSLTLQSEPGLAFEILSAGNPATPGTNWTSLGVITNVTGSSVFTDTNAPAAQKFYRARQVP